MNSKYNPDDDIDGQKVFVFIFTNYVSSLEEENLAYKLRSLGGGKIAIVENNVTWDPRVTHVIAKTFVKSEIVLAGKCHQAKPSSYLTISNHQDWRRGDGFSPETSWMTATTIRDGLGHRTTSMMR